MGGKMGRPRKELVKRNVELTKEERLELKGLVLGALRGESPGNMEPLSGSAFANLAIFFLSDTVKPNKGRVEEDLRNIEEEFEI